MRKSVVALVFAVVAALGVFAPVASAATGGPRVVIIVGATHGATAGYRADADKVYAEAIKYTSNVVKVYSPNATWAKVKAATKGASIVVYLGHGNGWPSPYTYDATYATKDGFGLNSSAGNGDYNNKYYGEPSVSTLDLAPNAVVILSHLCYASGNSEPGGAAPSVSTARKRVDNYGAGFLKAARAVIADGHGDASPYIRALFTTHASIDELWRSAPNFHGHVSSFPSTRTPGAVAFTDTDSATAGYYRSLVWRPGLTTDDVTGADYADSGVDPAALSVPGNAQVGAAGTSLFDADGHPTGSLPAGARLRVIERTASLASGEPMPAVLVEGIDDPSVTGWVSAADLIPRDSKAPAIWGLDTAGGVFSPNGDGRLDVGTLTGRFSESVDWRVQILDGETVVVQKTGTGRDFDVPWDGTHGGVLLPDGAYSFTVRAIDAWGNGPTTKSGKLTIDTVPAELAAVAPDADAARWFSPNGDASLDAVAWTATTTEPGTIVVRVYDADGTRVAINTQVNGTGGNTVSWDGRDDGGHVVPDGSYVVKVTPRDMAGTSGPTVARSVRVDTSLGFVTSSKTVFYPNDGDTLARSTTLGFKLTRSMTVDWIVRNAAGDTVANLLEGAAVVAGPTSRSFDGRALDGTWLPTGKYTAVVSATDGTTTATQAVGFQVNAFAISTSDSTPRRGQTITVYATSAESLAKAPRLYISQPGKATWSVAMTKASTNKYRVRIHLKTGSKVGTVSFRVSGTDKYGGRQRTTRGYTIH